MVVISPFSINVTWFEEPRFKANGFKIWWQTLTDWCVKVTGHLNFFCALEWIDLSKREKFGESPKVPEDLPALAPPIAGVVNHTPAHWSVGTLKLVVQQWQWSWFKASILFDFPTIIMLQWRQGILFTSWQGRHLTDCSVLTGCFWTRVLQPHLSSEAGLASLFLNLRLYYNQCLSQAFQGDCSFWQGLRSGAGHGSDDRLISRYISPLEKVDTIAMTKNKYHFCTQIFPKLMLKTSVFQDFGSNFGGSRRIKVEQ